MMFATYLLLACDMIGELEDAKRLCTTSNSVHNIMVEWEIHQSKNHLPVPNEYLSFT